MEGRPQCDGFDTLVTLDLGIHDGAYVTNDSVPRSPRVHL